MQLPAGCGQGHAQAAAFAHYPSARAAAQALGIALPASVLRSVPTRQLEFIAGRISARTALRQAGLAEPPTVGMADDRAPIWPAGFVGSITHAAGSAWAVAAPMTLLRAVGVDLEGELTAQAMRDLAPQVMASGEALPVAPHWPATRLFSLVFSAKESAYKCLAGFGAAELGFRDLRLAAVDFASGSLRLQLLHGFAPQLPAGFELAGGFTSEGQRVRTWMAWPQA
jgi:enterobactin synthetase component D